jgi:hypothetical protein
MKLSPEQVITRWNELDSERQTTMTYWQELTDFLLPRKNTVTVTRHPGEKRESTLTDMTGGRALDTLAGALQGMLTSVNTDWFEFTSGDPEIDSLSEVREWYQKTTKTILNILNNSNFQQSIHEFYIDLACVGTGIIAIEDDPVNIVSFSTKTVADIAICENNKGMIDEVYYEFKMSAQNLAKEYGLDNLPDAVQKMFKEKPGHKYEVIQAIYPDDNGDGGTPGFNFPFISQVVVKEGKKEVSFKGFNENPMVVARWAKGTGEVYGRSPGMNALADVKMLNLMQETMIRGAQKTIDPPLQVPDDGFTRQVVTRPGGITYTRPGPENQIRPIFNDARIDFGFQMVDSIRTAVKEAFFVNILTLADKNMSATETIQRTREQLRLMGPMLGRIQGEGLNPTISRVYNMAERRDMITQAPEALRGRKLSVRFISTIAKAQKADDLDSINQALQLAIPVIQMDPASGDRIDGDKTIKAFVDLSGADQSILRSDEETKKIREARAKQEQELRQQEQQSAAAKSVGDAAPAIEQLAG